jgi:hypothetical protein
MVDEVGKWILTHTNLDPALIARYFYCTEKECWEYLEDLQISLNEYDKQRNEAQIQKEARTWAYQLPEAYETKRLILVERLQKAKEENDPNAKKILDQYKVFTGKITSLTSQQIERARQYPLKDLVGTQKNITNCPFHDDRTASMNIKNNFYYCHGCSAQGDIIKYLMETDGLSFKDAVIRLQ